MCVSFILVLLSHFASVRCAFFYLRIKLVLDSQYIFGLISYFLSVFALDRICFYHYQFRRKVQITEWEQIGKKQPKHKQNVFFHVFQKSLWLFFSCGLCLYLAWFLRQFQCGFLRFLFFTPKYHVSMFNIINSRAPKLSVYSKCISL